MLYAHTCAAEGLLSDFIAHPGQQVLLFGEAIAMHLQPLGHFST